MRPPGPALAATVAHLVHHLFESSVTTPWLAVKTLADLAEVLAFVEAHPDGAAMAREIADAARRFGLERRLGALAGLLERALDRPAPRAWTEAAGPRDVDDLLRRCAPESGPHVEARRLADRAGAFARMPRGEKVAFLRHHLLPPPEAMRATYGLPAGSPWVWPLYPLRPLHLLARSALDAARLLWAKGSQRAGRSSRDRRSAGGSAGSPAG